MWTSQPTSGTLPPPCVDFSFTSPDKKKAVVFGGFQPPTGITFDTFILDMETWVCHSHSNPQTLKSITNVRCGLKSQDSHPLQLLLLLVALPPFSLIPQPEMVIRLVW